jgi:S1-C subfamily serine protease
MSTSTSPRQTSAAGYLIAGALGGLVVLVIGAILIATDVIDTGGTTKVVRQESITRPASNTKAGPGRTVADIYKKEGSGVVFIQSRGVQSSESPFGLPQEGTATGSGFVVDKDGTILTNAHVVEGASDVKVRFQEDGDLLPVKVQGRDPSSDLAVLKVDPSKVKLRPIPLGDSANAQVGDSVIAIGNPFGFTRTVTTGIVSALQRQIDAPNGFTIDHVIQTDASINPGNSGGPLLDGDGKVIGINSQIATGGSGSGSVGIGFAIPINTAKRELPKLRQGQKVQRAFIGVTTAAVTKQLAQDLNLPVKQGALVIDVRKGSPADKAGLRAGKTQTSEGLTIGGDVITKVDGKTIKKPDDVLAAIGGKKPGDEIDISYIRGGDKKSVTLKLGNRPASAPSAGQQPQTPNPLIP